MAQQNAPTAALSSRSRSEYTVALNAGEEETRIIWRFSDGRPGHDTQSQGLVTALAELASFQYHDVQLPVPLHQYPKLIFGHMPSGSRLPKPDIVIGAGHATHIPMLLSKWKHRSIAIVLMRPSIPMSLFDFCLVPQHDNYKATETLITTEGPLNSIKPVSDKNPVQGLILIGGPSRHFDWDETALLQQLQKVVNTHGISWILTDSPRTPASTRAILKNLAGKAVDYRPFHGGSAWLAELMGEASTIWVSEDSMSMIYETLSSGAAVGVLRVPALSNNKLSTVAESLAKQQMLTLFDEWQEQETLPRPPRLLNESRRCAEEILQRMSRAND